MHQSVVPLDRDLFFFLPCPLAECESEMLARFRWVRIVLCLLAASTLAWLARPRHQGPLPPLEVSLWYWKTPFDIPRSEQKELQHLGVHQLFVRSGTFRRDGESVRMEIPQVWQHSAPGIGIHLVFNFAYDVVRNYASLSNSAIATHVLADVAEVRREAEHSHVKVVGVQFDFDCPTRRLDKYADLLRRMQKEIHASGLALSITGLPTWFRGQAADSLAQSVDFLAPQYYEGSIPKRLDQFRTISDPEMLEQGIERMSRLGVPYYAGLPAYGHALMYDETGKLLGLYEDAPIGSVMRMPEFTLSRFYGAGASGRAGADAYYGEDVYDFVATIPARDGKGKGWHVVYDLPTPTMMARDLAIVNARRDANCRGILLFRYPEEGDTMSLPLHAIQSVLEHQPLKPDLQVQVKTASVPWDIIEGSGTHGGRTPAEIRIRATNTGGAGTAYGPGAVRVTLCFDRPGIEDVAVRDPGGFDARAGAFDKIGSPIARSERSSVPRANVLDFQLDHLDSGDSASVAEIETRPNGPQYVWGEWSAVGPGGYVTARGSIPLTRIAGQTEQTR
jgi:hypothetical protein